MCRRRGFALALVLWVMVLLSAVGVSLGYAVRVETATGTELSERVRGEALAAAGIRRALLGLITADAEQPWEADGRVYQIPWPDANLRVSMRAESGKIDLNHAPAPLLTGLFELLLPEADAPALAAALIDWRDRDDRRTAEGAEGAEYRAAGRWGPANAPLGSVAELGQVLGFDAEAVAAVAPYVTVFSRRPRVNPLVADGVVLAAVPGIGADAAARFVAEREALAAVGEAPDLGLLIGGSRYLDSRSASRVVSIRATAQAADAVPVTLEAAIDLRGDSAPYTVLDWRPSHLPVPLPAVAEAGP